MAREFTCPRCGGLSSLGTEVIFVIGQGAERSLVLPSPEFGDWAVVLGRSVPLEKGRACMFLCPIRRNQLASAANPGPVEIFAIEDDGSPMVPGTQPAELWLPGIAATL